MNKLTVEEMRGLRESFSNDSYYWYIEKVLKNKLDEQKTILKARLIQDLPKERSPNEGFNTEYLCGWNECLGEVMNIIEKL